MSTAGKTPRPSTRATVPAIPPEIVEAPPGARFGKFVCAQRLGAGAMGEVHKAWDTQLNRWVALKFLKGGDEDEIARFKREAQVAGKLTHPNIAAIYEVGAEAGRHFIAMQFIDGSTLKSVPATDRSRIVELLRDAARAVEAAHEQGIVHRDLKPDNLMTDRGGRVFVMDFGLARPVEGASQISVSGSVVGTPAYMPPEQARGEKVDARADVYSLGMSLYELLTDVLPFHGPNVYETLRRLQDEEPPSLRRLNPKIDADLETIVLKCIEKHPGARYQGAGELAADLTRWLDGDPISAKPVSTIHRLTARLAKRKTVVAVVAGALIAAGATVAIIVPRMRRVEQGTGDAQKAAIDRMRETARTCLSAAIELRRAGNLASMRTQAANAEAACRDVAEKFPTLAEPHYQLGRIYRAMVRRTEALAEQELALKKEPGHASARYERAVLLADFCREQRRHAVDWITVDASDGLRKRRSTADAGAMFEALKADLALLGPGLGDAERSLVEGLRAWTERRINDARLEFARASKLDEGIDALGELERDAGRAAESLSVFAAGIREDRGFKPYWEGRATARINLALHGEGAAQFERAADEWTEWLAMAPDDADAWRSRGLVKLGAAQAAIARGVIRTELFDAAMKDIAEAERLAPGLMLNRLAAGAVGLNRGVALARIGQDPVGAFRASLEVFQRVIDEYPGSLTAHACVGVIERGWAKWLAEQSNDPLPHLERSVAAFDAAIRIDRDAAWLYVRRGKVHIDWSTLLGFRNADPSERYRAAIRDFDEALRIRPRDSEALKAKGVALSNWGGWLLARGDNAVETYREAVAALSASIESDGDDDETWLSRGLARSVLARRGQDSFEGVMSDFDQALKINRDRAETWMRRGIAKRMWAMLKRARREDAGPMYQEALADLGEAVAREPWMAEAWEARGSIRISLGQSMLAQRKDGFAHFDHAVKDFAEAIKHAPKRASLWRESGVARDFAGVSLQQRGEDGWEWFEGALADLTKAAAFDGNDAETFWYRGNNRYNRAVTKLNRKEKAGAEFRAAIEDYERMKKLKPALAGQVRQQEGAARQYLEENPD